MKRTRVGGNQVWDFIYGTPSSPNLFIPLPPDAMLERKGEKFLWLRMLPTTDIETGGLALPDSKGVKGYIPTYEKTRKIAFESIQITGQTMTTLETSFGPIHSIEKLEITRDEDVHGANIPLIVKSFSGNKIEIEQNLEFTNNPYFQVNIDYTVKTYETIEEEFIQTQDSNLLRLELEGNLLVKVRDIWKEVSEGKWVQVTVYGFDYLKIQLPKIVGKGTRFKLTYDIVSPISIGYRTIDGKDEMLNDKSLGVQVGDLEGIISPLINLSKGDIIISTLAVHNEKEIATKGQDGRYRLKYNPVVEVNHLMTTDHEFADSDYIIEDQQYIRFTNLKPHELPEKVSVLYGFHPAYRVANQVSISALNQKQQPKKWIFKPDFSNVILTK